MKKALLVFFLIGLTLKPFSQTYTLQDVVNHIKTFDSHTLSLEGPRMLIGSYDTVLLTGTYFKIILAGELWAAGGKFGRLYQSIGFDARVISNDIVLVPVTDTASVVVRWDVVLKVKADRTLIHFRNEQSDKNGVHFIRVYEDVNKINIMFSSSDAANQFRVIAKAVFK